MTRSKGLVIDIFVSANKGPAKENLVNCGIRGEGEMGN